MGKQPYIAGSELILNKDGSIYHLNLLPEDLGDQIILVGDPARVAKVSQYFDSIEVKKSKREFITHTGYLHNKRLSVISTGIGTDNIDIVLNEIDALANINFKLRTIHPTLKSLDIIRLGTCGGLQANLAVGDFVVTAHGLGFDNLMNFYHQPLTVDKDLQQATTAYFAPLNPYLVNGDIRLREKFTDIAQGITTTCPGFYGPQGRMLRLAPHDKSIMDKISNFSHQGLKITNFEMETSAIYGLSQLLGHHACSLSVIIANRITQQFIDDVDTAIDHLIQRVLSTIVSQKNTHIF